MSGTTSFHRTDLTGELHCSCEARLSLRSPVPRALGFASFVLSACAPPQFGFASLASAICHNHVRFMEPTRSEVDALNGATMLEFGAEWCPICQGARALIDRALAQHPDVQHRWVEDGKGKPLGRSFQVKLWPTLIFLRDGKEVARVVRPSQASDLEPAFAELRRATP